MSAPETTSKRRPSLLSETAPGAVNGGTRILASLEGRLAAPQAARRSRFKKQLAAPALVALGLCAVLAWQAQQVRSSAQAVTSATVDSRLALGTARARVATSAPARIAPGGLNEASTQQGAVLMANETPSPGAAGADTRSRALANDAVLPTEPTASTVGVADASDGASAQSAAGGPAVARAEPAGTNRPYERTLTAARARRHGKAYNAKEDSDAEWQSGRFAHTKPYELHARQQGRFGGKASLAKMHAIRLAERVKECEKSSFFEAQACRWQVCSNEWGKVPACPSVNNPQQP